MGKMIRWQGLIAFVVIVALVLGLTYLFADNLVKSFIEDQASGAVGAKVEIRDVDLGLFPAGIVISGLDVADKDNPMQNLVSVANITAQFDLLKAFMGQFIVEDASVNGMQFNTQRKTSGALKKEAKKPAAQPSVVDKQLSALSSSLPDTSELLEREPLLTNERQEILQKSYQEKKAYLENIEQNLPNQDKIAAYQARVKAITDKKIKTLADFNQAKKELEQLKADILADKKTVQETKDYLANAQKELKQQINDLKAAPKQDKQHLTEKYTLDANGLANLSGLLFGNDIGQYTQLALLWYQRLAPYLESDETAAEAKPVRATGEFIRFKEQNPLPDFLIKHLAASAIFPAGQISATAKNITQDQDVNNRATTLHVYSEVLKNVKQLNVDAVFDYRKNQGFSRADFTLADVAFKQFKISGGGLPLVLEKATSQFKGQLKLQKKALSGTLHADFTNAQFAVSKPLDGAGALIADALSGIDQFSLDIELSGRVTKPSINIRSDLDKQLKQAVKAQLDKKVAAFKQQLDEKLSAKLNDYLAQYDLQSLGDEKSLSEKLGSLDDLLKTQLDDFKEQQKEQAKDKAKDALKDKLKGLF